MGSQAPPRSHLTKNIEAATNNNRLDHHAAHIQELALQIQHNLLYQHDWTDVLIHTHSPLDGSVLDRPILSGKPPRRVYIHPNELLEYIKADIKDEDIPSQREWVLPSHLKEKWTLRGFASIFDSLSHAPSTNEVADTGDSDAGYDTNEGKKIKRILLATVDDDSTVVYYIMHDGIVKPRQN